jgi:protocatechuate 3,4-dioxygenase beta subunit
VSLGLLFVLLALVGAPLAAQPRSSFRGTIADSATGQPVRRAAVLLGADRHARGDSLGRFSFDSVAPGRYHLSRRAAICAV